MPTPVLTIIIDAFRESGIVGVDEDPETSEITEGLRHLNRLVKTVFGNELGEPLRDINYGSAGLSNSFAIGQDRSSEINSAYVPASSRIVFNVSSPNTIYLNPNPRDGSRFAVRDNLNNFLTYPLTINANGRKIENSTTLTVNTNGANSQWFYRADLGMWIKVEDLAGNDDMPFPEEFDDFFITLLAIRLNPRYGAETNSNTVEVFRDMRRRLRARYSQPTEISTEDALLFLTNDDSVFRYADWGSDFLRGRI